MGWGGARPGSGPKKKAASTSPIAKAVKKIDTVPATPAGRALPEGALSSGALQQLIAFSNQMAAAKRPNVFDPYKFDPKLLHPPAAVPRDENLLIAMDGEVTSWANAAVAANVFGSVIAEGLLFLGYPYLAELTQRPEYRLASEIIADDATRKWIDFDVTGDETDQADAKRRAEKDPEGEAERALDPDERKKRVEAAGKMDKVKELKDDQLRLEVRDRYYAASRNDGFFGRSHLFCDFGTGIDAANAELKTPVGDGRDAASKAKVARGSFKALRSIEAMWVYPTSYSATNPLSENWYNPEVWYVMGTEVHRTRMQTFVGHPVPDMLKPAYSFGGMSTSQLVKPYVDIWLTTRESVAELIHAFSVMALSTNMATATQPGGLENLMLKLQMFLAFRDNQGLFMIDKQTEDFKNISAPLGGLHELQAQAQEHMASAMRYPLVKFTGISPSGLNASSEGEIQVYDDTVAAYQNRFFEPNLTKLINFEQLSLWGEVDPQITHHFEPLRVLTEKEKGEMQAKDAERDGKFVDMGALAPEEVRGRIIDDPDLPYADLDPDDVPDLMEEEEQGLEPEGGRPDPKAGGEPDGGGANDAVIPFVARDEWTEGDHPRAPDGKFGSGSGGGKQKITAPQLGMPHGHFTASGPTAPKRTNVGAPLGMSGLTKVGGQKGSNPGGVYEDGEGKKFYVKQGKSKDHVRNEMIAAALYHLAGAPTLRYRPVEGGGHVATEMAKLDKDNASKLTKAERAEASRDLAVHAWLANWDAVGLGGDNLGTVRGVPTALDLGGALDYRAQGSEKGKAFGKTVGELDTLRDGTNKDAAGVFGAMTPADLRESARFVTSIPDDKIRAAVEGMGGKPSLADKLIARKADIAARASLFGAEGDPGSPAGTMVVPAGGKVPVKAIGGVPFKPWRPPADWAAVDGQVDLDEPEFDPKGKQPASGVVIREADGRVWLVQPRGGFGGYEGTFPKGRLDAGLSMQANAIKEAYEESGLKVKIVGHAGDHEGDVTTTRYYFAEREGGDPSLHDDETEGVVLAPQDKADGFLNRKRDRDVLAMDEANFEEGKHPRDPDGKFASGGGGSSDPDDELTSINLGDPASVAKALGGKPKKTAFGGLWKTGVGAPGSKEEFGFNLNHVLGKATNAGSTYRTMLGHFIKNAAKNGYGDKVFALKKKLGEAYLLAAQKATNEAAKGGDDAGKYLAIAENANAKAKAVTDDLLKSGGHVVSPPAPTSVPKSAEAVTKAIAEQAMKDNPGMAAALKQKPTSAEMEKAKKSVALLPQYVPGVNDLKTGASAQQALKLTEEFNAKWQGKDGLPPDKLDAKVQDFKAIVAKVAAIKAFETIHAGEIAKKEAAAQSEKNKKAAEALKQQQQAAKAKNAEYMKALGISETEASGFDALVSMMSEDSSKADLIEKFKSYQKAAEGLGYPISGFQYALIRNYIDGGYKSINKGLRSNSPSIAQHVYARLVNNAIDKLPKFTGTVVRGTTLSAADLAVYQPGHVVQEHGFTSTGIGYKFGGNVHYTIKANGMRGGDFSTGANTGEKEVLFKAKTQFLIHKVEMKGGTTYIEMEEVEGHG